MKKLICFYPIIILSLILGFGWQTDYSAPSKLISIQSSQELNALNEIVPLDTVQEMVTEVDQERVLADLRRLTGVDPLCTSQGCKTITGRETGSEGLKWAKNYVRETLISLNYSVEILNWSRDGYTDQNIIARKRGLTYPNQDIYFIAHLDGYQDDNPAADDDASGAASLLELARILSNRSLSRSVVLFFSTGEEHGALGARSFVEQYPSRLSRIQYLVSVEMLSYDSNSDGRMELWNGNQSTDFVNLLSEIINAYDINLMPKIVTGCT